jgi:hypothetical protein
VVHELDTAPLGDASGADLTKIRIRDRAGTNDRSSAQPTAVANCTVVIPTYNEADNLPLLLDEIAQAAPEIHTAQSTGCVYELIDTDAKFADFVTQLKKQKRFAFDTETTGTDPMTAQLVGMSFSWKEGTGYYVPVKGPAGCAVLDCDHALQFAAGHLARLVLESMTEPHAIQTCICIFRKDLYELEACVRGHCDSRGGGLRWRRQFYHSTNQPSARGVLHRAGDSAGLRRRDRRQQREARGPQNQPCETAHPSLPPDVPAQNASPADAWR